MHAHPSEHDLLLASGCKQPADPPVTWTEPEYSDADDEEEYEMDEKTNEDDEQDKQSLCVAACTIALAIPALVGS